MLKAVAGKECSVLVQVIVEGSNGEPQGGADAMIVLSTMPLQVGGFGLK